MTFCPHRYFLYFGGCRRCYPFYRSMQDIFKDLQTKFSKLLIRIFLVILIMCPEPPEAYERAFCIVAVP
jgi:hypothetical protein